MILNRIHNALNAVHAENEIIMKTKNAVYAKASRRSGTAVCRAAAAAAVCCAAAVFSAGCYMYFTPVYAVSIDNGFSTELGVNRFDKVVSVSSDSAAADDFMHMNYTDALSAVLAEGGSGEDADVTVSGNSAEKTNEMITAVEGCRHDGEIYCHGADSQTAADAAANGMTLGRYAAYLELKEYEPGLAPGDVSGMTARDIRNRICEHTGEEPQYDCGGHHGQGAGQATNQGAGQYTESGQGAGKGQGKHSGGGHGRHGK